MNVLFCTLSVSFITLHDYSVYYPLIHHLFVLPYGLLRAFKISEFNLLLWQYPDARDGLISLLHSNLCLYFLLSLLVFNNLAGLTFTI